MSIEELSNRLIEKTYTRKDVGRRLRLLREYFEGGFFAFREEDVTKFLLSKRATTDDIDAFMSFGERFFAEFTKDTFYRKIQALADTLKQTTQVTIYIPYEPVPAEVVRLGTWCRKHITGDVVIDLKTDPTLLGGCAFVWKGVYKDYSLRYYMRKKRDEITKVITEYIAKFYKET